MLSPRRPSHPLRLLPLALVATQALAADPDSLPFGDAGDTPTVLSATRLSQSLFETPAAVTVIDRQMIEQTGVREIPELLRMVPGMVVGYDQGSEAFVSFHGTSADLARRMQVLVDGRSIYQPLLASVDWVGLPLELPDIERIEVIRGPNASSWGANSFLAVVNIVTRHPADVERARVSYRNGEDGISDYVARLAQRTREVDWRLTVAGRSDDGFEHNSRFNSNFTDSKDIRSAYGRAIWTPSDATSLELSFGLARTDAEEQYRVTYFYRTPDSNRENNYLSLALEQDLGDRHHLRLQASQSVFKRDETWWALIPPLVFNPVLGQVYLANRTCANGFIEDDPARQAAMLSTCTPTQLGSVLAQIGGDPNLTQAMAFRSGLDAHERRTVADLQDTWIVSPTIRAVVGATLDRAEVDSQVYLKGHGENDVVRAFAHAEWRFALDWLLNVGGNQEFDEGAGDYFSPRYAINWQFRDNQVLRAVYSEAVRTPDILEEQADFTYIAVAADPANAAYSGQYFQRGIANGTAPTERIASSELGYFGRFDKVRVSMDLRVYRDRLELAEHNLDITDSDGFVIRPTDPMWMTGAEWSADWRPMPSQRLQLTYAYIDMDGARPDDDNTNFVPQHSGSVGWWQDYGNGLQFGTTYYFYNDLRTDRHFLFDRLDNRLAKTFRLTERQQLTLAGVLQSRLTGDPELREENRADPHRAWVSADWRY